MMAQETDLKLGCLLVAGEVATPLPLKLTAVDGEIVGAVARVKVIQHFDNPLQTPIDLEYLFPLPHEGAVVDYQITIGERVIRADIKEAEAARQVYNTALEQGQRASLLEQRRPNLFSIRIGNVQPSESVITELHYEERLKYHDGEYEFVFPMGITPKYHTPGTTQEQARRVDAPVTQDETQVAPVEISLTLHPGLVIDPPTSATHPVQVTPGDGGAYRTSLAQHTIPNKDFVLRFKVSADVIRTALVASRDGDVETALITLLPPRLDGQITPAAREFIFVIDRSGSMNGKPIEQAKNALRACIRALGEKDTFTIQAFDDQMEWFNTQAVPVTQANVSAADRWLDQIAGRGGTEILPAIEAALTLPVDAERQRYVVFLTDGAVSTEEEALRQINRQRGQARVFSFGIGPSVNRYLLAKLAQMGRGAAEFLRVNDDIETAITRFQDRVSYPVLQDITLEWQGAESWDTYPEMLPDLYIGQPLEIVTRLKRQKNTTLTLKGTLQGKTIQMSMDLPPAADTNPTLQRIWARARIESLLDREVRVSEKTREQIIALALDHRIVTPFTSFVAVDSAITSNKDVQQVRVAVPLPEGLDFEGFFGSGASYLAASVASAPLMRGIMNTQLASRSGPASIMGKALKSARARLQKDSPEDYSAPAAPLAAAPGPARLSAPIPEQPAAAAFQSIEDRLKWLARTQNVDGSWDGIEMTAAALLAFVRAGHTTREGSYRRQVDKAARWLSSQLAGLRGFDLLIAARALQELNDSSGDYSTPDSVKTALPAARSDTERAARGLAPHKLPASIQSLDDLRIMALLRGGVETADALKGGDPVVQTWLAVGKTRR